MDEEYLQELIRLVSDLPDSTVQGLVNLLREEPAETQLRMLERRFGTSRFVVPFRTLLSAGPCTADEIALVLQTILVNRRLVPVPQLSLVWSGPALEQIPMRRTAQVIVELIDAAQQDLFMASFAVYNIEAVLNRLAAAVERGVQISMLVETPASSHHRVRFDPLQNFPEDLRRQITFLIWPYQNRVDTNRDYTGSLHAKFILQDDQRLFLSSANLTGAAMESNIELGIVIEQARLIGEFKRQLETLVRENVLVKL